MGKFLVVKHPEWKETKQIYENDYMYGKWFLSFAVISEKDFKYLDKWPPAVEQWDWQVKNLGSPLSEIPTYRVSR